MKKLINITIFNCLICIIFSSSTSAQVCGAFTPAIVTPPLTTGASPTYTGSFAITSTNGLPSMEISVGEAPVFGFSWISNLACAGAMALPSGAKFPDVAILEGQCTLGNGYNTTWYAWVVYGIWNSTNYNAMYDVYEWDQSSCQWATYISAGSIPNASGAAQGTFDNVIRIDAAGDQFAIIWDDLQTTSWQGVQAIAGASSVGLSTAGSVLLVGGTNFIYPDLSIFAANPYSSPLPSIVWYTYADLNNSNLLNVGQVYWNDMSSAALTSNNPSIQQFTAPCSGVYAGRPRIACPDGISNSTNCPNNEAFTVVSEYQGTCSPGTYDIIGYTYDCSSVTLYGPNIYTDGSMGGPCSINANQNTDPAVSYDYVNGYLSIGWDSQFSNSGGAFIPPESIIAGCDITGNYLCASSYLVVPTGMCNGCARHLSISGRDYNYNILMYYTYYDSNGGALVFKDAATNSCSLRLGKMNTENTPEVLITPNPFVNEVTLTFADNLDHIKVFDMTGNLSLSASGNQDKINRALNELTFGLPQGVYMLRLDSENSSTFINKKLIKM